MPKSKKPPVEIKPEFVLPPPGSDPSRKKKKKKNAPDRQQPEWMFPPEEDNPVLNPKPKSEAQRLKNEKDREQAIKFLRYKSVTAPMKAAPPDLLLTLVGAFLTSYGFDSTSRIYTTQLHSRKKLDEWRTEIGVKLPKDFPDLVKIFKEWHKGYQEKLQVEETSSSDSQESDDAKMLRRAKKATKANAKAEAKAKEAAVAEVIAKNVTSSSGSESSSEEINSDVEMKDVTSAPKTAKKLNKSSKISSSSKSTSSSSSDSDADDEKENAGAQLPIPAASRKPTVNGLVNKLKRKASPSGSSISKSESESKSESDSDASSSAGVAAVPVKKEASSLVVDAILQPQDSLPT